MGEHLPKQIRQTLMMGIGLATLVVGIAQSLEAFGPPLSEFSGASPVIVVGCILLGGVIGEVLGIERRLEAGGERLKRRFGAREGSFTEGFVVASLVFCVGPIAILGSLRDGLTGDYSLLGIKSILDGFGALAFASVLGWGVGLSALTILVYQGGLTLFAGALAGVFDPVTIAAVTATGGILILAIGLRLLEIQDIRAGNMLPALILAPLAIELMQRLQ